MQQAAVLASPEITERALNNHRRLGMESSQHNGYLYENHKIPLYHLPTVEQVKECNTET